MLSRLAKLCNVYHSFLSSADALRPAFQLQCTVSVGGGKRKAALPASQGEKENMVFMDASQPSMNGAGAGKRQKKASFVERPIRQNRKQKAAAQAPATASAAQPAVRRSMRRR